MEVLCSKRSGNSPSPPAAQSSCVCDEWARDSAEDHLDQSQASTVGGDSSEDAFHAGEETFANVKAKIDSGCNNDSDSDQLEPRCCPCSGAPVPEPMHNRPASMKMSTVCRFYCPRASPATVRHTVERQPAAPGGE